jgi:HD-like signal output (HDOD) protein
MSEAQYQVIFNDILEAIESNRLPLPTQPEIAIAIEEATQDPNVTVGQLNKIIVRDPALTARMIRIANSPLVRGRMSITSLENAISRLGLNFVANMAIGLAMEQLFQAKNKSIEKMMKSVWKHSAKVAGIAQMLAMKYCDQPSEHASLAGLLHEIGILPILSYSEKNPQILEAPSKILDEVIQKTEAKLGEAIMLSWQFHPNIAEVPVKFKEIYIEKPEPDLADMVLVAKLHVLENTQHPLAKLDRTEIPAYARMGLDPTQSLSDNPSLKEGLEAAQSLLT